MMTQETHRQCVSDKAAGKFSLAHSAWEVTLATNFQFREKGALSSGLFFWNHLIKTSLVLEIAYGPVFINQLCSCHFSSQVGHFGVFNWNRMKRNSGMTWLPHYSGSLILSTQFESLFLYQQYLKFYVDLKLCLRLFLSSCFMLSRWIYSVLFLLQYFSLSSAFHHMGYFYLFFLNLLMEFGMPNSPSDYQILKKPRRTYIYRIIKIKNKAITVSFPREDQELTA